MKADPFKAVHSADLTEYCGAYHCAGDCGLPHNQRERDLYLSDVLAAFDRQEREANRPHMEKRAEIERKARKAL